MKLWHSVKWKVTEWHSCTMRSPFQTIQLALTWLRGRSLSCGFPFYALTRTSKMKINQDYVHFKYTLQTQLYGYAISNPLTTSKYNRVSMIFFFGTLIRQKFSSSVNVDPQCNSKHSNCRWHVLARIEVKIWETDKNVFIRTSCFLSKIKQYTKCSFNYC